ncbi:N/A [soil metagenome]
MKVSIVFPAYNEEHRITNTLISFDDFFKQKKDQENLDYELLVVINNTTDNSPQIVQKLQETRPHIRMINTPQGGKGWAIKLGFQDALTRDNDVIGFNDADMSTSPEEYYKLIRSVANVDGIIASRYMPGATVIPPRPKIKRLGSRLVYEPLIRLLFGLNYYDYQCGAKLFKRAVIARIAPEITVRHWAIDLELLYLCKRHNYSIYEFPTVWVEKDGSKLHMFRSGMKMLGTVFALRWHYFRKK